MRRSILLFLIPLFIIAGCKSPTSVNDLIVESGLKDQLKKINIKQTDYYTILIENSDSLYIEAADTNNIREIISGYNFGQKFIAVDTLTYRYSNANDQEYLLSFKDTLTVPDTSLYIKAGVKYIFNDSDSLFVIKDLFLLLYPYSSVHIIIDGYSKITAPVADPIQDFVYRPPILYYHPYGPNGLYKFDFTTFYNEEIYIYAGGDFFDMNSTDAFIDYGHHEVIKYNLERDTVLAVNILEDSLGYRPDIYGLAVNDSLVYVLTDKLITLNTDLEIISIREFLIGYIALNFYEGFFYVGDGGYQIIKIDPETLNIIDTKKLPSIYAYTFKVENGMLYFMENQHRLFCSVPLDDVFPPKR